MKLKEMIDTLNPIYADDDHVGLNYLPHVTDKNHGQAKVGQNIIVKEFSLVEVLPAGSRPNRKVIRTYPVIL